jgi:hypothetical protein
MLGARSPSSSQRAQACTEDAADETGLPLATYPETCPWVPEQVLEADFLPEVEAEKDAS